MTAIDRKDHLTRLCARLFGEPTVPTAHAVAHRAGRARIGASIADHADWREASGYWAADFPPYAEKTAGYGNWKRKERRP